MNISSPEFQIWQNLEDHWNKTQLCKLVDVPTVPVTQLYKHMIDNNGPILPFQLADESIDDTAAIWTLFSHIGILCYSYRIAYTSGTRNILLLLFLVPTCHASTLPTFTIRFYATYYCGWWCWGSTHLWKWWQGWTACCKALWRIMTCISNGNLHRQRVNRINKHSHKQVLNLDHWILSTQNPGNAWWAHMVSCKT